MLFAPQDDNKANSDSLCVLPPELLIPAATIGYLSKAEECASPVDFLRMYLSPVQPALDSGTLHAVSGTNIKFSHTAGILTCSTELGVWKTCSSAGVRTWSRKHSWTLERKELGSCGCFRL